MSAASPAAWTPNRGRHGLVSPGPVAGSARPTADLSAKQAVSPDNTGADSYQSSSDHNEIEFDANASWFCELTSNPATIAVIRPWQTGD